MEQRTDRSKRIRNEAPAMYDVLKALVESKAIDHGRHTSAGLLWARARAILERIDRGGA